jgi:hypothetical protein
MKLRELVDTSARVRETTSKNQKKALIARLLKQARGKEISIAADYLAGTLPSGRLNIGWRTIVEATPDTKELGESLSLRPPFPFPCGGGIQFRPLLSPLLPSF